LVFLSKPTLERSLLNNLR